MQYMIHLVSQESERMVVLITLIRRNLAELDLGLKGDLTMSEPMERLANHMAEGTIANVCKYNVLHVTRLSNVNAYLHIHHLAAE